jgi:hypothetical protein
MIYFKIGCVIKNEEFKYREKVYWFIFNHNYNFYKNFKYPNLIFLVIILKINNLSTKFIKEFK